jgi:hypothetical protein
MSDGIERAAQRIHDRHRDDHDDFVDSDARDARVILDANKQAIEHLNHYLYESADEQYLLAALALLRDDDPMAPQSTPDMVENKPLFPTDKPQTSVYRGDDA